MSHAESLEFLNHSPGVSNVQAEFRTVSFDQSSFTCLDCEDSHFLGKLSEANLLFSRGGGVRAVG